MKKILLFAVLSISLLGCKINKTVNGFREGVWKEKYALDNQNNKLIYKSKEVYKKGMPVGTWKYYLDGKINKKERYCKDSTAIITYYYSNGKVEKKGKAKTEITLKELHWFYSGHWKFYSAEGKLDSITQYKNGIAVKTDCIKQN